MHRQFTIAKPTDARVDEQPRVAGETFLQANSSTVEQFIKLREMQRLQIAIRARELASMPSDAAYNEVYVWSLGDGLLLRTSDALELARRQPDTLDLLRQRIPLTATQRLLGRFNVFSSSKPADEAQRVRLGQLLTPNEVVAMLRATHALLVSVFSASLASDGGETVRHSVTRLGSAARLRPEEDFGATSHGAFEYALSATVKASLLPDDSVALDNRLELMRLPSPFPETAYVEGEVHDNKGDTAELREQGNIVQLSGQLFTAVASTQAIESPDRIAALAFKITEPMRFAANQAIAEAALE